MATCQTSRWVSTSPYVKLTVTQTSSTDTTSILTWTLQYISDSAANTSVAKQYTVSMNGTQIKTGTYDIDGKTGTNTIAGGTQTISKEKSPKSVTFQVNFSFNLTWSGTHCGTRSASCSITVPEITSYKVRYNANGGSGAPSTQTKWHGTALTLSGTKPTRTGYSFQGWATSASGSVVYTAGGSYTNDQTVTLYAVWKANTYKVTYNANGGKGAPAAQTKTYGVTLTLSATKPTRTNYTFKGWGTSSTTKTVSYVAGASYTSNAAITLYAIWELSYTKPRITGLTASRCDSSGTDADTGMYARVKFNWTTDETVSSIVVKWIDASGTSETASVTASGTSGAVDEIIGSGALDTEKTYTIRVTVTDSSGTTSKTVTLGGTIFAIDFLKGGKGVAFGKPAETSGYADFAFEALFDNTLAIAGRDLEGNIKEAFQPQNENGNTVIGWGNYDTQSGYTNVYGHEVHIGVSNIANPDTFRPYRHQGDSITFSNLRTSGYVTNAGADVTFLVPFAVPIIGSPTVTVTSNNGFVLRQNEAYTHGSGASTYVFPDSYTGTASMFCGVYVVAKFSNTTNVVNNSPIGIYWSGTITFT